NMGLVPAWGGSTRLVERVGAARAADILLTARAVPAEEALATGLATRGVAAGAALEEAEALAGSLASAPREALVAIKRSVLAPRLASRGDAIEREQEIFESAWGSAAHQAAMARFRR